MPILDNEKKNLRITSIEVIILLKEKNNYNYNTAIKIFYNICRRKHQKTGFKIKNYKSFYNMVMKEIKNFRNEETKIENSILDNLL